MANTYLLSNSVVPGMGLPVAGAGVRVYGLWQGLLASGFDTTMVVPLQARRGTGQGEPPPPGAPGVELVDVRDLSEFFTAHAPCTVITTNTNQIARVPDHPGVRLVVDFFAPKSLEGMYSDSFDSSVDNLDELRARKLEALSRAAAIIVNGRRKVPYYLGWVAAAGLDPREMPLVQVPTPVEVRDPAPLDEGPLSIVIAGFRQGWSRPGALLAGVPELLDEGTIRATAIVPSHWAAEELSDSRLGQAFTRIMESRNTTTLGALPFEDFRDAIAGTAVNVDAFEWNLERQYAMVTRTVVALATGLTVIHPDFTEVSAKIAEYEAGWTYEEGDTHAVAHLLAEIAADPAEVERRRANAVTLARDWLDPETAVRPLASLLTGMES